MLKNHRKECLLLLHSHLDQYEIWSSSVLAIQRLLQRNKSCVSTGVLLCDAPCSLCAVVQLACVCMGSPGSWTLPPCPTMSAVIFRTLNEAWKWTLPPLIDVGLKSGDESLAEPLGYRVGLYYEWKELTKACLPFRGSCRATRQAAWFKEHRDTINGTRDWFRTLDGLDQYERMCDEGCFGSDCVQEYAAYKRYAAALARRLSCPKTVIKCRVRYSMQQCTWPAIRMCSCPIHG